MIHKQVGCFILKKVEKIEEIKENEEEQKKKIVIRRNKWGLRGEKNWNEITVLRVAGFKF